MTATTRAATSFGKAVHAMHNSTWIHDEKIILSDPACGTNNNRGGGWYFMTDDTAITCKRCIAAIARRTQ